MPHQQLSVHKSLAGTNNQKIIYTVNSIIVVGSNNMEEKSVIKQHSLSHATAKQREIENK